MAFQDCAVPEGMLRVTRGRPRQDASSPKPRSREANKRPAAAAEWTVSLSLSLSLSLLSFVLSLFAVFLSCVA